MSVNIWVTAKDGERIPICWGVGMVPDVTETHGNSIVYILGDNALAVRETPAEIMALIAAEERKQQRREIAARIMAQQGEIARERGKYDYAPALLQAFKLSAEASVAAADALLAALDAREGVE